MVRRLCFGLIAFAAAIGSARAGSEAASPPATQQELQARLEAALVKGGIPGAGVVVFQHGQPVWVGGVGAADKASGRNVDAQTHFRIGSITKAFLAIAILQQVEQGRLGLDDEVARLLPDIHIDNAWQASDPVRVKHLLEHTAGFDDMHFRNMPARPGNNAAQEMRRFSEEFRVRWRPGERMSYSNPGYGLLGLLLETVSGREQREYISAEVLRPLGMTATVWQPDGIEASLALGYDRESGEVEPWEHISMPAAGSLVSTPQDMARALGYYLSRGASVPGLLTADSFARLERTETTLAAKSDLQIGYGAGNYFSQRNGWALRGHSGGIPGYWANLIYNADHGFGYVVMLNVIESPEIRPLQLDLIDYAAQGLAAPVAEPAAQADPQWNGWYRVDNPRNEFIGGVERLVNGGYYSAEGDRYRMTHAVLPDIHEMIALADDRLRDDDVHHANGLLTRDADGRRVMVTDDNVFVQGSWWSVAAPQYAVTAATVLLLSTLFFAPVWLVRALRGKLRAQPHWRDRLWPLAAALVLLLTAYLPFGLRISEITAGVPSWRQLAIAGGGWLFAVLAIIGMVQVLRHWRRPANRTARWHTALSSAAATGLALWMWQIHLLGIRLWAW